MDELLSYGVCNAMIKKLGLSTSILQVKTDNKYVSVWGRVALLNSHNVHVTHDAYVVLTPKGKKFDHPEIYVQHAYELAIRRCCSLFPDMPDPKKGYDASVVEDLK